MKTFKEFVTEQIEVSAHGTSGFATKHQGKVVHHETEDAAVAHAQQLQKQHGGEIHNMLEATKWVTDPQEPATGLKRGDSVMIQHPTEKSKMISGTYLQTGSGKSKTGDKTGQHLIKHTVKGKGDLTDLHWHSADRTFRDVGDGWKGPRPVK